MATLDILRHEPEIRSCAPGETVFDAGDAADCMYAVIEGAVEIRVDGRVIERLAPGGVFGEMALIDGRPRSAAAVAAPDAPATRLAVISEKRFLRLVSQTPQFAIQMMRLLTERLRRLDRG
jgi:CRP-like cAMP-binding protein